MFKSSHYKNKIAFVIGASEGIGKSVAKGLLTNGANVVILSRSAQKLEAARSELEREKTGRDQTLVARTIDVRDFTQTRATLGSLISQFGVPDFVVNTAGFARPGYLTDLDIEHIREMMELNYFGTVHVCKAVLPELLKAKRGHIVNTSSIAGFIGLFGYTGYSASKFAVVGFSEALKREVAPLGVKVSVLCPPNTKTPGLENENKHKPAEVLATEEKVKVVDPDYVANDLLKALPKNKFLIIPTLDGTLAHRLNRFLPGLLEQFVKRPFSS
ncbi:MAG TPA: SDR family oxidoreductase [Bdellovibrionales bacterium]|nr:SDR family oxidoreductase [Bdellovibrionales bacterium]